MNLVDDSCPVGEPLGEPLRELEAEIEPVRSDMEEEVTGCGRRVMLLAAHGAKRMQALGTRDAEQAVPRICTDADHARQIPLGEAETD